MTRTIERTTMDMAGRGLRVIFEDFSGPQRGTLQRALERDMWLVPRWLHKLTLEYCPALEGENSVMRVCTSPEYLMAEIQVSPSWFGVGRSAAVRRADLVHELVHLHNLALVQYAHREFRRMRLEEDDDPYHDLVRGQLDYFNEEMTENLAVCICAGVEGAGDPDALAEVWDEGDAGPDLRVHC